MTLTRRLRIKINQLAEFGAEQEPRLPAENGRDTNHLLRRYERDARSFDLLSAEEEVALAKKMEQAEEARLKLERDDLDLNSRAWLEAKVREGQAAEREFIESNLRLVIYWAEKCQGQGLELLDLIQAGNIGLIHAVRRFDHTLGYRFSSYGSYWIRQRIRRAIADQARTVRIPVYMDEKIRRLSRIQARLVQKFGREPTVRELAVESDLLSPEDSGAIRLALRDDVLLPTALEENLEAAEEKVRRILRVSRESVSLEMSVGPHGTALHELIEHDKTARPDEALQYELLREHLESCLKVLSPRECRVIEMRFGLHHRRSHTLQEIGDEFDLTRERIRQIEEKALRKLEGSARARGLAGVLGSGGPFAIPLVASSDSRPSPLAPREAGREVSADGEEPPSDDESPGLGLPDTSPCCPALVGDITPIAALDLSRLSHKALSDAGVTTVGQLAVMSALDLRELLPLNAAVTERIPEKLRQYEEDRSAEAEHRSAPQIRSPKADAQMAAPFSTIFVDREEAHWAFDLLNETLRILDVTDPRDERFSLGLRNNRRILRLSIGEWWGVLQFASPDWSKYRVGLALIDHQAARTCASARWKLFEGTEADLSISVYRFPTDAIRPLEGRLRQAYQITFAYIAGRFADMDETRYRKYHIPELVRAVFDRQRRLQLLTCGI